MVEKHPGFAELQALDKDINKFEAAIGEEDQKHVQLVDEARRTPTENEGRLQQENESIRQALAATQGERDDYKKQLDDLTVGVKATRTRLEGFMKKRGVVFTLFLLLVSGILGGALYHQYYAGTPQTAVAATTEPKPGFVEGLGPQA